MELARLGEGIGSCRVILGKAALLISFHSGDGGVCRRHQIHSTEESTASGASQHFLSKSLNYRVAVMLAFCFESPSLAYIIWFPTFFSVILFFCRELTMYLKRTLKSQSSRHISPSLSDACVLSSLNRQCHTASCEPSHTGAPMGVPSAMLPLFPLWEQSPHLQRPVFRCEPPEETDK